MKNETKKEGFEINFNLPPELSKEQLEQLRSLGIKILAVGVVPAGEDGPPIRDAIEWGERVEEILGFDPLDKVENKKSRVIYGNIE